MRTNEIVLDDVRRASTLLVGTRLRFGLCGDIDVAVLRSDPPAWASELSGTFRIAQSGELHEAQPSDVAVTDAHEIHVDLDGLAIELLVSDVEGDEWVYRRDRRVRRMLSQAFIVETLPLLAPEIVLLFKAKLSRDKDAADFEAILPLLDAERRAWLCDALETAHPEHPRATRVNRAKQPK